MICCYYLIFLSWILLVVAHPILEAKKGLLRNRGNSASDFVVTELPGLTKNIPKDEIPEMHAGQLEIHPENNTHYFFWRFSEIEKTPDSANRTIFWLNGGPGCSSMDGALMETGPFHINRQLEVESNPGSWHKKGDIVFVDQPAGTGFSFADVYDHELGQVAWDFLVFMDRYFTMFPDDLGNEIVLAGESYAGQYIPYIARAILDTNEAGRANYRLKGLLIGNGYISPNEQSLSYIPFSLQAGFLSKDTPGFENVLAQHEKCQDAVAQTHKVDVASSYGVVSQVCDRVLNAILEVTRNSEAGRFSECINMYDYSLKDLYPSCGMNWPPDLVWVNPFLRSDDVMVNLNLENKKTWHECDGKVSSTLKGRNSEPSVKLLPALLEQIEIVLFHGNKDIICNYMGAEEMIKNLEWNGAQGFSDLAVQQDWFHNNTLEGYVRSDRNLTFVNVFDSSHMVPFDKPEASRGIIDMLLHKFDTRDSKSPAIDTHPLGYVTLKATETTEDGAEPSTKTSESHVSGSSTALSESSPTSESTPKEAHTSRAVRLIQLAVVIVLIWGMCAMYLAYRSKPASIIKTKPNNGRKKNVQWADQMNGELQHTEGGFLAKAFGRGKPDGYAPVGVDDIELSENMEGGLDDFIIGSDDDDTEREH